MAVNNINSGLNSLNSIYGNRNVISGLASGMDTESMIQNAVSGIKAKITGLGQKRTMVEWQQSALRSVIDKMYNFSQKYTSYASSTNLLSSSFFNSAVKVSSQGVNASKIAATGKTTSDIRIMDVTQLASAASYKVSGLGEKADTAIEGIKNINLGDTTKVSELTGSLTLNYDGQSFKLDFTAEDVFENADDMVSAINTKLGDIKNKNGEPIGVTAELKDGSIVFNGNASVGEVRITGASGKLKDTLGIEIDSKNPTNTLALPDQNAADAKPWYTTTTTADALNGKEISITLDGVTKKFTLNTKDGENALDNATFFDDLQKQVDSAFGGKVVLSNADTEGGIKFKLDLGANAQGSTMIVSSSVGQTLGLASNRETSYVDTGKTIGELLGDKAFEGMTSAGKNEAGEDLYAFELNGMKTTFSKGTSLDQIMAAINNDPDSGVRLAFSKTTNQFQFTAKETGADGKIEFGGELAQAMFGVDPLNSDRFEFTAGQDAQFSMEVNGVKYENVTRTNNTFDVDGLSITLKDTFAGNQYDDSGKLVGENQTVTFTSGTDTDKLMDAIKSMVKDYNEMAGEIKKLYTTLPGQKSNGSSYLPLTEEDMASMSESSIKAYEEKAKQGILFADRDLSSLYERLTDSITSSGLDGVTLRSIGINTTYSQGTTTLEVDEDKLRAALESDPDKVRDAFTKSTKYGANSDGLMQSIQNTLDVYGKTVGTKGILVNRAGSARAPVSLISNTLQDQMSRYDQEIAVWETKLAKQVDRYTSQFTQLEQLIAQMNSQSSTLAGLMGGGGGY